LTYSFSSVPEAKLPREKTLATLDLNRFAAPLRGQIRQLLRGELLAGAINVCLIGRPGTGKSHLMAALGRAPVEHGHPVLFTSVASLVEVPESMITFERAVSDLSGALGAQVYGSGGETGTATAAQGAAAARASPPLPRG
jgi:predicted AAA+ superfamily ATPase